MFQTSFTPLSVIDSTIENYDFKPVKVPVFRIVDPEMLFAPCGQNKEWQKAEDAIASYFRWSEFPGGHPIKSWEMLYLVSTIRATEMARSGNFSAIHSRLRVRDLPLSQEERDLLADRAEGKLKFKRGRKKKNTPQAYLAVLLWCEIVEGEKKKDAIIAKIEEYFGVSYSHVNSMLGKIYGTSDAEEIRELVQRISDSEFGKAEIVRFMKDLFSK